MKTYREFINESLYILDEATSGSLSLMNLINKTKSQTQAADDSPLWGTNSPSIPKKPNIGLPDKSNVNLAAATKASQSPSLRMSASQITKPTSNFATPAKPKEDALTTWAKTNKSMIQKSGTQAQKDILSQVETGKTPTLKPIGGGSIFDKEGGRDQYLSNMKRAIRGGSQYNSGARTMDVTNMSADKG